MCRFYMPLPVVLVSYWMFDEVCTWLLYSRFRCHVVSVLQWAMSCRVSWQLIVFFLNFISSFLSSISSHQLTFFIFRLSPLAKLGNDSCVGPRFPNSREQSINGLVDAAQLANSPYQNSMLPRKLAYNPCATWASRKDLRMAHDSAQCLHCLTCLNSILPWAFMRHAADSCSRCASGKPVVHLAEGE